MVDFMLMDPEGMGWSWQELEATPPYVRRYCLDILGIRNRVRAERRARERR
jgi:hypothetical protein